MREIKFRGYDKERQKIYQITDINFSDYIANGVCYGDWKEFSINNLLQYTGLKDKNGVEIYEGDIVKIKNDNRLFYLKWFDDMSFGFADTRSDYIKTFYSCYDTSDGFPLEKWIEVIGNIYENKELLNTKG